jgi:NAD+ synthase (glutamine-hydrolysing)
MKIAVCQVNPTVADLEGNIALCLEAAELAAARSPDLILFPELALTGCHPKDILFDPGFTTAAWHALADFTARATTLPPVLIGTVLPAADPTPEHPNLYNAAVLVQDADFRMVAAKRRLPAHDVYAEPRWFLPGPDPEIFEIGGQRLLALVGGEHEVSAILPDANHVLVLAATPFIAEERDARQAVVYTLGRKAVYANLVGANDDLIFDGGSFALDGSGYLIGQIDRFTEQVAVFDMEAEPVSPASHEPPELLYNALSLGIRDFAAKNAIHHAFLGLSGGIDSALVAVLAAEALGPARVTGVAMPSRYTNQRSTEAAEQLAQLLGINFEIVNLEPLHAAAETHLAELLEEGLGAENLQARLRMVVLMAYVNRHSGMLLNTGNKTEASLGYATLYGDTAGTLAPIGDLTKPRVYQLAAWINRHREIIPEFSIARPPSAELRPDQVDPFDYDEISPELEALVRANQSNPAMRRAEHKRAQMGIVLKVSPKAFGPGRLIPITRK